MWLLIRHADGLVKSLYAQRELGKLTGELVIKSQKFKKYATLFCLAFCQSMEHDCSARRRCERILRRAGAYNVLHKYEDGGVESDARRKITVSVFKDLDYREITEPSDILAIAANVCSYNTRILVPKIAKDQAMSLSLGILTLCMSNGEMIKTDSEETALSKRIFDFLEDQSMSIGPPLQYGALTFIKHCRVPVSRLSAAGIHTEGILWKLSDVIRPDRLRQSLLFQDKDLNQNNIFRNGLDDYQRHRMFDLLEVLNQRNKKRYQRLANNLRAYLNGNESPVGSDDWPSKYCMDMMAACIVNAIDSKKYLQLARPIGGLPKGGRGVPYRAIFTRDRDELRHSGPTYIFTSWSRTKERKQEASQYRSLAKYVSVEVSINTTNGLARLKNRKWANGLCFFDGEANHPFVFEWPDSLCR
ncbi:uncharacterized protein BDZ99DRAFT_462590 [Mytilinidion resinicola]|uniref:Uncharacterized protein n=1 Tax=Mytilinidion resinicola TaxID=574789 RepID=A0A6A6YME1_9PEZI|nr:uncharacterized protein BDZ99DRAFT_462590 [Mytilinidion resinicola]KAF2809960.1 hypothetical protein BDZ99DRAFT_462590 [Mytilinidion resinicola]